ncbi:hypothetical protein V6N11_017187 [Hibiscus sabdariffa]|uniref:Uncharacterized protein n=1 Tax=Hibiscus sabdariffa TaxID=183260 RepID=A0ABR2TX96_9ROSI
MQVMVTMVVHDFDLIAGGLTTWTTKMNRVRQSITHASRELSHLDGGWHAREEKYGSDLGFMVVYFWPQMG